MKAKDLCRFMLINGLSHEFDDFTNGEGIIESDVVLIAHYVGDMLNLSDHDFNNLIHLLDAEFSTDRAFDLENVADTVLFHLNDIKYFKKKLETTR